MAYQKESWMTRESLEMEYTALLEGLEFPVHESETWPSTREYLQYKVIPDIIHELIDDPANGRFLQELAYVRESIITNEIGVGIACFYGEVEDVELTHVSNSKPDGLVTLMVLTRPNIIAGLESYEDREELISRFKQVLLDASEQQTNLIVDKKFVPYSKV